jgi:predicted Rossmann-fold nucleotide-binding protein
LTWAQLGIHAKPCALLDVDDYFANLTAFFEHAVASGFLAPEIRGLLLRETEPEQLLDALERYTPPAIPHWMTPDET